MWRRITRGIWSSAFSASSGTIFPQLRYAGRLASDPLNVLSGEQHLFDGTGSQTGTNSRWGDYSDLTVDPVDDCTFYYTNEYYQTTTSFNWRTRIGYFRFAECTAPQKGTAHFTITLCNGGAPVANASVSIDGRPYGATIANGTYDASLAPGAHTYTVSKPTVGTASGNFNITNGQTTPVNVCLGGAPTPTATPAPTPTQCVVPNFIGTRIRDATRNWVAAGFNSNNITTIGNPAQKINSQSLPAGFVGNCGTTRITVSR